MKIVTVIGARPQFVKAAVVSRALAKYPDMKEVVIHTGQHFDANMSTVFFDELDIPKPDYNLGIGGGTHGQNTGRMLEAVESVLLQERPDYVLVYGDTDSTLAGALAAAKLHIPVAHVEAGLRSFNRAMPEEINRVLTDHISSVLFTPTKLAVNNLKSEGIVGRKVVNVGDVMCDAAFFYADRAEKRSTILQRLKLSSKSYILATLHRQENVDNKERLANILTGLAESSLPVLLPLHPRTRKKMEYFKLEPTGSIQLIEPVGYLDMVMLEKHAAVIATDSGDVQKEAYFHKVPCITFRDETEWVELVDAGVNRLVAADAKQIASCLNEIEGKTFGFLSNLYGDGNSADLLLEHLQHG